MDKRAWTIILPACMDDVDVDSLPYPCDHSTEVNSEDTPNNYQNLFVLTWQHQYQYGSQPI